MWKNNCMHGKGKYTWPNGRVYEGDYTYDKKEGHGVYRWPDGRKYEGGWKNGKQDGEGTYTNASGSTKRGVWRNGKRVQWLGEDDGKQTVDTGADDGFEKEQEPVQ